MKIFIFFVIISSQCYSQTLSKKVIDDKIEMAKTISEKDQNRSIPLYEDIRQSALKSKYQEGILISSNMLMMRYFDKGDYKRTLSLGRETEGIAENLKDNKVLSNVYRVLGMTLSEIGYTNESLTEFKKASEITDKIEDINFRHYQRSLINSGLASYFAHINAPVDSVVVYQKKSLYEAEKIDNSKDYLNKKFFTIALAYINLGKSSAVMENFDLASNYFLKALEICQNKEYQINISLKIAAYNELSWLEFQKKNYEKAVEYAKWAETVEKYQSSPYIRRDIFEVFMKSYVELGNKSDANKYMALYTSLNDSIVNIEKRTVVSPLKYITEKQQKNYYQKLWFIVLLSIFFVMGLLFLTYWRRKRYQLNDDIKLRENIQPKNTKPQDDKPQKNTILDDTQNKIIQQLEKFESENGFLQKEISLTNLANMMNTNTRYLSEVIKMQKGKSFNDYINGLRIQHVISKLHQSPEFRKYKISYLSEYCGFSSREVFAVIFKKETQMSPSQFISQLK